MVILSNKNANLNLFQTIETQSSIESLFKDIVSDFLSTYLNFIRPNLIFKDISGSSLRPTISEITTLLTVFSKNSKNKIISYNKNFRMIQVQEETDTPVFAFVQSLVANYENATMMNTLIVNDFKEIDINSDFYIDFLIKTADNYLSSKLLRKHKLNFSNTNNCLMLAKANLSTIEEIYFTYVYYRSLLQIIISLTNESLSFEGFWEIAVQHNIFKLFKSESYKNFFAKVWEISEKYPDNQESDADLITLIIELKKITEGFDSGN